MDTIITNSKNSKTSKPDFLSLFRMGIFVAAHRWGWAKKPHFLSHISYNDKTWQL